MNLKSIKIKGTDNWKKKSAFNIPLEGSSPPVAAVTSSSISPSERLPEWLPLGSPAGACGVAGCLGRAPTVKI